MSIRTIDSERLPEIEDPVMFQKLPPFIGPEQRNDKTDMTVRLGVVMRRGMSRRSCVIRRTRLCQWQWALAITMLDWKKVLGMGVRPWRIRLNEISYMSYFWWTVGGFGIELGLRSNRT